MPVNFTSTLIDQIIKGRCAEFAALMGMRKTANAELQINVFLPGATAVEVLQRNGKKALATLSALHDEGLFSGVVPGKKLIPYKLRVHYGATAVVQDDPYRFPCRLDRAELQLFAQGQHDAAWQLLGAQRCNCDDVDGVQFVLWAPAAQRVSLLCDLNGWDARRHVLRCHAAFGLWELFIPGFAAEGRGHGYKFEVLTADHNLQCLPFDPFAREVSSHSGACSRLAIEGNYLWLDHFWQQVGRDYSGQGSAIVIREVAITTDADEHGLNWKQLVPLMLEDVRAAGFTHVLLTARPVLVHHDQHAACSLLAPDPALGTPDDLRMFIDQAHEMGLGVLWDVPLLSVLQSLGSGADAAALLEPHMLDGPLLSILLGYFSYWRELFHADGFRIRDVDGLLQLPTPQTQCQPAGKNRRAASSADNPFIKEWLSQFLQRLRALHPGLLMVVETSASLELLTQPPQQGGLGFDYRLMPSIGAGAQQKPFNVKTKIAQLVSLLQDGNRDHSLLSLSWRHLAGDGPQASLPEDASVALLMLALWTLPGRKHVQLDCVLRQSPVWRPEKGHDWELQPVAGWPPAAARVLRELNQLYRTNPCLYEVDASHEGITMVLESADLFAYERKGRHAGEVLLIVLNAGSREAEFELMPNCSGQFHLRYHTPFPPGVKNLLSVVQSAPCRAADRAAHHKHKLLLNLPACSGAVYAWQG